MPRTLITAFRQQYPLGGVVSELICIHDGLYVVRVTARVDDQTLATGLAAHNRIESAEDEALVRALSHIGSATIGSGVPPSLAVPPPDLPQAPPAPPSASLDAPLGNPPISPWTQGVEAHTGAFSSRDSANVPILDSHALDDPGAHSPGLVSPRETWAVPLALPVSAPPYPVNGGPLGKASEPPFDPVLLTLEGLPTPSIDLSDIIAQTDVELQRLGWNVNQGREFLEKTYGKRSRHDLSDEELLEFLLFLETQPTPDP